MKREEIAIFDDNFETIQLREEVRLLRQAVVRYGDKSRMGTVEPMALQQAVDRAFEFTK